MKNKDLGKRIKDLRVRKGYSQEELAENSGLSLRTIQRIENSETDPRGDTLKRLANTFGVAPDAIIDWTVQEDKGFLLIFNLSALSFLLFPVLGILVPMIMWISKKDKVKDVNKIGRDLLNFQITWTMVFFLGYIVNIFVMQYRLNVTGDVDFSMVQSSHIFNFFWIGFMYLCNLVFIVVNSYRINKEMEIRYFTKFVFIKK